MQVVASPPAIPESTIPAPRPISVCLLISSLEYGGAERQVVEMMRTFDRTRVRPIVCTLSAKVPLGDALMNKAECLHVIEKRGRFDFTTVFRVASLLRREKIDVVHAFLFDSEMVARLAAPLAGVRVVISSERNTEYARPFIHKVALKLTRPLFDVMVANSNSGKQFNIRTQGLDSIRIEVVHNGVDTERFFPNREAGITFRKQTGIPLDPPLVGMIASFKRQKGHDNFLHMAALVRQSVPNAHFLVVGGLVGDPEDSRLYESEIRALCTTLGLDNACTFIGNQKDMNVVYNACDLTALLSRREGTPNVVLESMACGVPVVASDIADNALIIKDGTTGCVVTVDDPGAAAARVAPLLKSAASRAVMGAACRDCVCSEFSLSLAAKKLENLYIRRLNAKAH